MSIHVHVYVYMYICICVCKYNAYLYDLPNTLNKRRGCQLHLWVFRIIVVHTLRKHVVNNLILIHYWNQSFKQCKNISCFDNLREQFCFFYQMFLRVTFTKSHVCAKGNPKLLRDSLWLPDMDRVLFRICVGTSHDKACRKNGWLHFLIK